jgi:hypothetical protein
MKEKIIMLGLMGCLGLVGCRSTMHLSETSELRALPLSAQEALMNTEVRQRVSFMSFTPESMLGLDFNPYVEQFQQAYLSDPRSFPQLFPIYGNNLTAGDLE